MVVPPLVPFTRPTTVRSWPSFNLNPAAVNASSRPILLFAEVSVTAPPALPVSVPATSAPVSLIPPRIAFNVTVPLPPPPPPSVTSPSSTSAPAFSLTAPLPCTVPPEATVSGFVAVSMVVPPLVPFTRPTTVRSVLLVSVMPAKAVRPVTEWAPLISSGAARPSVPMALREEASTMPVPALPISDTALMAPFVGSSLILPRLNRPSTPGANRVPLTMMLPVLVAVMPSRLPSSKAPACTPFASSVPDSTSVPVPPTPAAFCR